jgi:hypothetical protein
MKNFWEPAVKRIQKKLKRTEKRVRKRTLQRLGNLRYLDYFLVIFSNLDKTDGFVWGKSQFTGNKMNLSIKNTDNGFSIVIENTREKIINRREFLIIGVKFQIMFFLMFIKKNVKT